MPDAGAPAEPPRAMLGAASPELGHLALSGGVGMVFVLPHATVAARLGTGAGTRVELRYRNLAAFGHEGRVRFGWGGAVSREIDVGVALRGSMMTLAEADGGLFGIDFSNLALGNDLEVGSDLLLTFNRGERANVTASIGPTWTLGGERYTGYRESSFAFDPAFRAVTGSIQGEWPMSTWLFARRLHFFLRLDGMVLLDAEIRPLGLLPTGTLGLAWSV
jgi:hypothetical protein